MKITKNNRTVGELRQCNGYKATMCNMGSGCDINKQGNIRLFQHDVVFFYDTGNIVLVASKSDNTHILTYTIEIDIPTTPVFTDDNGEEISYGEMVEVRNKSTEVWQERILLYTLPITRYPYKCVANGYNTDFTAGNKVDLNGWSYCRKIKQEEKKERKLYMTDKEYKLFCEKNDLDCK